MEDRFLTLETMSAVSDDLMNAGFKHVVARHYIDPKWRAQYRPNRPELEPIAWTVAVYDYSIPLDEMKKLVAICEKHDLTLWFGATHDDEGTALYLKVGKGRGMPNAYSVPNR